MPISADWDFETQHTIRALNLLYDSGATTWEITVDWKKLWGDKIRDFVGQGRYAHYQVHVTSTVYANPVARAKPEERIQEDWLSITWNPTRWIHVLPYRDQVEGFYSPIVDFAHEFGHVWDWVTVPDMMYDLERSENPITKNPWHETMAMRFQNQVARHLGQADIIYHGQVNYNPIFNYFMIRNGIYGY